MDYHHTYVGVFFGYLGAKLVTSMSPIVFEIDQNAIRSPEESLKLKSDKVYVCSVFAIILGLIQLITSVFLTVKEKFLLKIWSFIHIGLALAYMIMFLILIGNVEVEVERYFRSYYNLSGRYSLFYAPFLCQNFLMIIPVAAFNLLFKRITQPVGFINPPNIPFGQFGGPVVQAPSVNFNPMQNAAGMPYTPSYQPQPQPYPTTYPATNTRTPLNESARPADNSVQP